MTAALLYLLVAIAGLLLLPSAVLLTEVLLSSRRSAGAVPRPSLERPRVAILMPAHNEAGLILDTLRSIQRQLRSGDQLVVVADNCTDATAALAASAGAEVVVRRDAARRGKGYALDAGVHYLRNHPPAVVIVIDADCQIEPGLIDTLACRSFAEMRPVQARYLMRAPPDAPPRVQIAALAWTIKNDLRPSGLYRAGLPCQLMGTGMAIPWRHLSGTTLASAHLVEDLKLGIDLALAGAPPLFCPEARITSTFPTDVDSVRHQRTRWEHGHLGLILSEAPALLLAAIRRRSLQLLALGLDLCVPPLALLALLSLLACSACLLFAALTGRLLPLGLSMLGPAMLIATAMLCWRVNRIALPPRMLLHAVGYALWKVPLYLQFLAAKQTVWIRSGRAGEPRTILHGPSRQP